MLNFNGDISFPSTSTSTFIKLVKKSVQTSHQPTRAQSKKTISSLEIVLQTILIMKQARNISQSWLVGLDPLVKLDRSVRFVCNVNVVDDSFVWCR